MIKLTINKQKFKDDMKNNPKSLLVPMTALGFMVTGIIIMLQSF